MKAVVAAFNQEKALVGAFSVITNLRLELFEALISSHHQVTARSRSVMNVKLTSFSLSRCKMIVPSKSRPGLGVRLHLSRVLDPSIGGHHLQYLHYTALPTLCQPGKRISAQQTENSFMRPRILSGPWAVGLNIFHHISISTSLNI